MAGLPTALALGAVAVLVAGCATDSAAPRTTGPTGTTATTGDAAGPSRTLPAASKSSTGAPLNDTYVTAPGWGGSGVVEVRTGKSGATQVLAPPKPQPGQRFGASVYFGQLDELDHLSPSFVLVGSPGLTVDGKPNAGGVYVFEQTGKEYRFVALMTQDDIRVRPASNPDSPKEPVTAQAGAEFGAALDGQVYEDSGATEVYVGAPGLDVGGAKAAGGVYVLDLTTYVGGEFYGQVRNVSGVLHTLEFPGTPRPPLAGDRLGATVARGTWGAPAATVDGQAGAGLVMYQYPGPRNGPPLYEIFQPGKDDVPGKPVAGDGFGSAITTFHKDGELTAWIGVPGKDVAGADDAGLVAEVRVAGAGEPRWRAYTENDAAGQQADRGDRFGSSLCVYDHYDKRPPISVDEPPVEPSGRFLLAGAPGKRVGEVTGAGAVVGLLDAPTLTAETMGGRSKSGAAFGTQLFCGQGSITEGNELLVGAPGQAGTVAHGLHRHGDGPLEWDLWTLPDGRPGDGYGTGVGVRGWH
jgi:hypothetical protein